MQRSVMANAKNATTTVVFIVLAALFAFLLIPRIVQVQSLRARSEGLEKELLRLKKQNEMFEYELRLLKDDPVYLEKVARAQFNKAKEGEVVYKVIREGQNTR